MEALKTNERRSVLSKRSLRRDRIMRNSEKNEPVNYRLNRAKETLREINIHIENELWNTAINRLYYACYYAATALLLENDIKASTHAGVRQVLSLPRSRKEGDVVLLIFLYICLESVWRWDRKKTALQK